LDPVLLFLHFHYICELQL